MVLGKNYMKRLKYILQHRYAIKVITILVLIFTILYTQLYIQKSIYKISDTRFGGLVYKKKLVMVSYNYI